MMQKICAAFLVSLAIGGVMGFCALYDKGHVPNGCLYAFGYGGLGVLAVMAILCLLTYGRDVRPRRPTWTS